MDYIFTCYNAITIDSFLVTRDSVCELSTGEIFLCSNHNDYFYSYGLEAYSPRMYGLQPQIIVSITRSSSSLAKIKLYKDDVCYVSNLTIDCEAYYNTLLDVLKSNLLKERNLQRIYKNTITSFMVGSIGLLIGGSVGGVLGVVLGYGLSSLEKDVRVIDSDIPRKTLYDIYNLIH